ncbi:MAG TPA: hypothetical protein PLK76_03290 [bacterium]|nr:hypothetical protein [bacterium]
MPKKTHSYSEKPIAGEKIVITCNDGKEFVGYRNDGHITGFSDVKVPWNYDSQRYVVSWQYVNRDD